MLKRLYPILFLKQNNQMIKLEKYYAMFHRENEFTGLIQHFIGLSGAKKTLKFELFIIEYDEVLIFL